eukprot:m.18010 g.18010  ORF g.18010 m.18010 type:complete len:121 (-) comp11785_c0_seq1:130-492(-)
MNRPNNKPSIGDAALFGVALVTFFAAPNYAFSILVILMYAISMYLLNVEFSKALGTVTELCADLAKVNEKLGDIKDEMKTARKGGADKEEKKSVTGADSVKRTPSGDTGTRKRATKATAD